jgi:eukaryotic-like serine/threonine-protein kinase
MTFLFALALLFQPPGMKIYLDPVHECSMKYPETWQKRQQDNVTAFLSPREDETDMFAENVNIMWQDLSAQPMTLKEFTELSETEIRKMFGDTSFISIEPVTFAKQEAMLANYYLLQNGKQLRVKQYWFMRKKYACVITYTADPEKFAKFEDEATKTMLSFSFY